MVGSLRKDGRVQGWYKVPAASANKLYPLNCGACVKLEEMVSLTAEDWERTRVETQRQMHLTTMIPHPQHQLAKCVIPTPVTPGATEAQVYDALFKKGAVCLGADPRLQALQDICAKTLQGYQPQLTGNDITFCGADGGGTAEHADGGQYSVRVYRYVLERECVRCMWRPLT